MRYYRLDRYILGKYLKTFLLALALIIIIVITFDSKGLSIAETEHTKEYLRR